MEESYFTIRWKRLLISGGIVAAVMAVLSIVQATQQTRLSDQLLATACQLATSDTEEARSARSVYEDYLEINGDDVAARVELIEHVIATEQQGTERDKFVVSQATLALRGRDDLPEIRLALIDAAIRLEWFSTANQWLDTSHQLKEQHPRLVAYEGLCLLRKGKSDEAEAAFRTALLQDKTCRAAWVGLIELQEARSGTSEAIQTTQEWISKTNSPEAWLRKAQLLVQAGDAEAAARVYETGQMPSADHIDLVREVAAFFVHELSSRQPVEESVLRRSYELLKTAVREYSYDDMVCLADLSHRLGDVDQAQRHYQQCLENRPGDVFAMARQVELFGMQGDSDRALDSLERLPNYSSQKVLKTTLRAKLLIQQERYEEAAIELDAVVRLPTDIRVRRDAFAMLIESLWALGRHDEAAVHAQELLSLSTSSETGRRFCAEALIRCGRYGEAIKCIHGFLDSPREQINAVWRLLDHAERTGRAGQLEQFLRDARQGNRGATVAVISDAMRLADQQKTQEAQAVLLRAQVEEPGRRVFVVAREALEARVAGRLRAQQIQHVSQLTDPVDQSTFLTSLMERDQSEAITQLQMILQQSANNPGVLKMVSSLLEHVGDHQELRNRLLQVVYPHFNRIVQQQGMEVVPEVAEVLCRCGLDQSAFPLLTSAMKKEASLRNVDTFLRLMRAADVESPFHVSNVESMLRTDGEGLSETCRAVLQVEVSLERNHLGTARDEMRVLLLKPEADDLALLVMMHHVDRLQLEDGLVSHPDLALRKTYPENASVQLACSRWNRHQEHYTSAVSEAQKSYVLRPEPGTLIELAYVEWLDNQPTRATQLLKLAMSKNQASDRSVAHRDMLKEMLADSRMNVTGIEVSQLTTLDERTGS